MSDPALAPVTGSADEGPQSPLLLALLEIQARALRHYSGSYTPQEDNANNPYGHKGTCFSDLPTTAQLAGWATPTAQDHSRGTLPPRSTDTGVPLSQMAVIAGWATPSSRDWKDTPGMATTGTNPDGSERTRLDQLPRQAAIAGPALTSSPAPTEKRGGLNPDSPEMAYGLPKGMGLCCDHLVQQLEEEINAYANAKKIRPGEALSSLWSSLSSQILRGDIGRSDDISSPPILLSFLRQLTDQGWQFAQSILSSSEETNEAIMRSVWWEKTPTRPSYQRGLEGQQTGESPDAMCVLSSILARYAQAAWGEAFETHASYYRPLVKNVPARVVRLRGYGNAIVPQVAAEFVSAYLDTQNWQN